MNFLLSPSMEFVLRHCCVSSCNPLRFDDDSVKERMDTIVSVLPNQLFNLTIQKTIGKAFGFES